MNSAYPIIGTVAVLFYVIIPFIESMRLKRSWRIFRLRLTQGGAITGIADAFETENKQRFIWIRSQTETQRIALHTHTQIYILSKRIERISQTELSEHNLKVAVYLQKAAQTLIIFDMRPKEEQAVPHAMQAAQYSFCSKTTQSSTLFWISYAVGITIEFCVFIQLVQTYAHYQTIIISLVALCAIMLPFTPPGLIATLLCRTYKRKLQAKKATLYKQYDSDKAIRTPIQKHFCLIYLLFALGILTNATLVLLFLNILLL